MIVTSSPGTGGAHRHRAHSQPGRRTSLSGAASSGAQLVPCATTAAPSLSNTPTEAPAGDGADSSAQAQDAAAPENSGDLTGWAVGATGVALARVVIGLMAVVSRRRRMS